MKYKSIELLCLDQRTIVKNFSLTDVLHFFLGKHPASFLSQQK